MPELTLSSYEDEALNALIKADHFNAHNSENEALVNAVRGVGFAILHAAEKPSVAEMIAHCAETDHVLELRLIDTEVFGVRCSSEHCAFRTEWRV